MVPMTQTIQMASYAFLLFDRGLSLAIFLLAVVGLVLVLTTREDAFRACDRQKQTWSLLLVGASLAAGLAFYASGSMILWVIAAVIVGVYWQDTRPAIKDVLANEGGIW
ncbi:hypothetical protein CHEID_09470 [Corynebacterium heidelbergense]|nr:hypothetical protein CHEID_09470 [Corynebacterium heidelbergense]